MLNRTLCEWVRFRSPGCEHYLNWSKKQVVWRNHSTSEVTFKDLSSTKNCDIHEYKLGLLSYFSHLCAICWTSPSSWTCEAMPQKCCIWQQLPKLNTFLKLFLVANVLANSYLIGIRQIILKITCHWLVKCSTSEWNTSSLQLFEFFLLASFFCWLHKKWKKKVFPFFEQYFSKRGWTIFCSKFPFLKLKKKN